MEFRHQLRLVGCYCTPVRADDGEWAFDVCLESARLTPDITNTIADWYQERDRQNGYYRRTRNERELQDPEIGGRRMKAKERKAFPLEWSTFEGGWRVYHHQHGMDLRDYFAAHALSCLRSYRGNAAKLAQEAYAIADAMVAVRRNCGDHENAS